MPNPIPGPAAAGSLDGKRILEKVMDVSLGRLFGDVSEEQKAGVLEDYTEVVGVLNDFLGELVTINEIWARRMRDEFGRKDGVIKKAAFADMLRVWGDASNDFLDEREAAEAEEGDDDGDEDDDDPEGDREGKDEVSQVVDAEFTVE